MYLESITEQEVRLQGMYLLLVTNRNSNILEDLDTLRLLSKLVPEYAGSMLDEEAISRAAFDLIFAFDEVISLGHKENITVQQVKQNCEMESHEEKLHKMIIQSKINDTKDIMKRKAMEIDKTKVDQKRMMPVGPGYNPGMSGMSGKKADDSPCLSNTGHHGNAVQWYTTNILRSLGATFCDVDFVCMWSV